MAGTRHRGTAQSGMRARVCVCVCVNFGSEKKKVVLRALSFLYFESSYYVRDQCVSWCTEKVTGVQKISIPSVSYLFFNTTIFAPFLLF